MKQRREVQLTAEDVGMGSVVAQALPPHHVPEPVFVGDLVCGVLKINPVCVAILRLGVFSGLFANQIMKLAALLAVQLRRILDVFQIVHIFIVIHDFLLARVGEFLGCWRGPLSIYQSHVFQSEVTRILKEGVSLHKDPE